MKKAMVAVASLFFFAGAPIVFAHEAGPAHEEEVSTQRTEKSGTAKAVGGAVIIIIVAGIAWKFFFKKPPSSSTPSTAAKSDLAAAPPPPAPPSV